MGMLAYPWLFFGRVSGGTNARVASVGADLIGKVDRNISKHNARTLVVIADNHYFKYLRYG